MTDKQLQKLGRRELLEMLLEQAKESERLNALLKETDEQLHNLEESYERLRDKLDRKDERIHELEDTLETERGQYEAERGQYARSREQHEAQRAALLEKYTAQHEQFEAERTACQERYETGLAAAREQFEAELESARQRHEAEMEEAGKRHAEELAAQREELEAGRGAEYTRCEAELGSIAEAALEVSGVFEAAQRAADHYLKSLRELYPLPEGVELPPQPEKIRDTVRKKAPAASAQKRTVMVIKSEPEGPTRDSGRQDRRAGSQFRVKRQNGEGKKTLFFD